jgi:hypothetical protein
MLCAARRMSYTHYETKHLHELSEKLQPQKPPSQSFMINYRVMNDKRYPNTDTTYFIRHMFLAAFYVHINISMKGPFFCVLYINCIKLRSSEGIMYSSQAYRSPYDVS